MKKEFIELTNTSTSKKIIFNVNYIASIEVHEKGTLVAFPVLFGQGLMAFIVSESYDEVIKIISEHESYQDIPESNLRFTGNSPVIRDSMFCPYCGTERKCP